MKAEINVSSAPGRICLVLLCVLLLQNHTVAGDSFAERFAGWVFGSDTGSMQLDSPEGSALQDRCLACHDGLVATRITTKRADTPMLFSRGSKQVVHPTGMNYDEYARARAAEFRPRAMLDWDIVLIDGVVTCVSCHRLVPEVTMAELVDAGATQQVSAGIETGTCLASGDLAAGPRITDLCLSCHVK